RDMCPMCAEEMVSSVSGEAFCKRRRAAGASPPADADAHTAVQARRAARCRKQTLMSKLSDSGFEEDLGPSPTSSSARIEVSPAGQRQLSTWYLQYGDVGYRIQRENEAQFHSCKSLAGQPQLTAEARCTLVSWLIPVHRHFRLSFECLCLAVNIVDRFLASTPVAADCFQLVGVTALLLASKQVCSPRISHLLSFCCDAFTKEQLCNLECLILLRLNFRLAAATMAFFLDYYTNCMEAASRSTVGDGFTRMRPDRRRSRFARKVCELSLADYAFNKYPPSLIASSALWLASDLMETKHEDPCGGLWGELCTQPVWGRCDLFVNAADAADRDFGDYGLDFMAGGKGTAESLS
uniref:G2/mitotic-specific cyclin-B2 n=1 Tax=Mola mola TaxID=94237 RepID=A0A3Q3XBG2_MOLML